MKVFYVRFSNGKQKIEELDDSGDREKGVYLFSERVNKFSCFVVCSAKPSFGNLEELMDRYGPIQKEWFKE